MQVDKSRSFQSLREYISTASDQGVQLRGLAQTLSLAAKLPQTTWIVSLTIALVPWYLLPPITPLLNYTPLHTLLELLAIAVALMVSSLAWNVCEQHHDSYEMVVGAGFLAVCLTDIGHTLSYAGMPDFISPNSADKAMYFGLATRYLAAVTMLCTALLRPQYWSQGKCAAAVIATLAITAMLFWAGLFHAHTLPALLVPEQGQTLFKVGAEYFGASLYATAACLLSIDGYRSRNADQLWLAAAAWTMGLSELFFTLYVHFTDLTNLLGHVYKVIAYGMVYRALFVGGVRTPYRELASERSRLQAVLKAIPDPVWMKNQAGVYLACNATFEQIFGNKQEDTVGKTDYDLFPPELAESFRRHDQIALTRGGPYFYEERVQLADGDSHIFEASRMPIYLADGSLAGIFGIARDITAKKLIEDELRLAAITFESQEGIFITDANGVILRVNGAFTKMTGYSAQESVGCTPSLLKSGRHDAAFYAAMGQSLREKGSWHSEIWNQRKNGEVCPQWLSITAVRQNDGDITHFVANLTDITERKAAAEQIQYLSLYDSLTQLPNRKLMYDRLDNALRGSIRLNRQGALLLIDLDDFKILNETQGYEVGDQLLAEVGARLHECVGPSDSAARIGGDEFAVIIGDLTADEAGAVQAEARAKYILDYLGKPYRLQMQSGDRQQYQCSLSAGISLFGDGSDSGEELLRRAEAAMNQAKAADHDKLQFFDPRIQAAVVAHAALEADLRRAITEQQLFLHYQPQVETLGKVIGAEALIRWQHPERGTVWPGDFIPLAEETGLIVPIGQWVLQSACVQLAQWSTQPAMAHLCLAVNVSALQFAQPDFIENTIAVIRQTGAPANKLKLELTESLLAQNTENVIGKMLTLTAIGVHFSLDDFGTGYSSLSYLKRLPLHQLKIDRSFVRDVATDPNDAAITDTIVALGRTLGLNVIAEGVETESQRDFLSKLGCRQFQGYLFSKPLPITQFEALVRDGHREV